LSEPIKKFKIKFFIVSQKSFGDKAMFSCFVIPFLTVFFYYLLYIGSGTPEKLYRPFDLLRDFLSVL